MGQRELSTLDRYIAGRVREARPKGVSASVVAEAVGVSHQQYTRYERGENRLSASMLYEIARYYNQPIAWFFLGFVDEAGSLQEGKLSTPKATYSTASGDDQLAIVARHWQELSEPQRQSILQLLDNFKG